MEQAWCDQEVFHNQVIANLYVCILQYIICSPHKLLYNLLSIQKIYCIIFCFYIRERTVYVSIMNSCQLNIFMIFIFKYYVSFFLYLGFLSYILTVFCFLPFWCTTIAGHLLNTFHIQNQLLFYNYRFNLTDQIFHTFHSLSQTSQTLHIAVSKQHILSS